MKQCEGSSKKVRRRHFVLNYSESTKKMLENRKIVSVKTPFAYVLTVFCVFDILSLLVPRILAMKAQCRSSNRIPIGTFRLNVPMDI